MLATGRRPSHRNISFEFVKRVYITFEPFTPDNNLLTPTLKIRRFVFLIDHTFLSITTISHRRDVYAKYKDILDRMYKEDAKAKAAKL